MRTGLRRNYGGEMKTVQESIAKVVRILNCPSRVYHTAIDMYHYLGRNTSFRGLSPSMQAITLVNLAAKERSFKILTRRWEEEGLCAYNILLEHSKEFKKVLEKSDQFPNLKYIRIGRS